VSPATSLDLEAITAPFGRDVIEQLIPHREPFLFVDEVLELEPGARVVARKEVRGDEWYFAGHFPGRPVLPGVIMVEALAQACAIAVFSMPEHHGKVPLFGGIDKIRFKRIVSPGEELIMTCKVELVRGVIGRGTATGRVGDELAVRGSLVFLP
jgi:3-hydroxyacyl-[acyl-carrier-protein] dehydratase